MAHILIEDKEFKELNSKVDFIIEALKEMKSPQNQIRTSYIDITEAAQALGISVRTLHKRKADGSIGFIKKGGKIYFKTEEIESYLESNSENQ